MHQREVCIGNLLCWKLKFCCFQNLPKNLLLLWQCNTVHNGLTWMLKTLYWMLFRWCAVLGNSELIISHSLHDACHFSGLLHSDSRDWVLQSPLLVLWGDLLGDGDLARNHSSLPATKSSCHHGCRRVVWESVHRGGAFGSNCCDTRDGETHKHRI